VTRSTPIRIVGCEFARSMSCWRAWVTAMHQVERQLRHSARPCVCRPTPLCMYVCKRAATCKTAKKLHVVRGGQTNHSAASWLVIKAQGAPAQSHDGSWAWVVHVEHHSPAARALLCMHCSPTPSTAISLNPKTPGLLNTPNYVSHVPCPPPLPTKTLHWLPLPPCRNCRLSKTTPCRASTPFFTTASHSSTSTTSSPCTMSSTFATYCCRVLKSSGRRV
jgi:hypothetical protein